MRPRQEITFRCTAINGLTDQEVRQSQSFAEVMAHIGAHWPAKAACFTWGNDGDLLTRACRQHRVRLPFRRFIDLTKTVQQILLLNDQPSVRRALQVLGLKFDGCEHVAVSDARNTARIHAEILRRRRSLPGQEPPTDGMALPSEPTWFGSMLQQSLRTLANAANDIAKRGDHSPIPYLGEADNENR